MIFGQGGWGKSKISRVFFDASRRCHIQYNTFKMCNISIICTKLSILGYFHLFSHSDFSVCIWVSRFNGAVLTGGLYLGKIFKDHGGALYWGAGFLLWV